MLQQRGLSQAQIHQLIVQASANQNVLQPQPTEEIATPDVPKTQEQRPPPPDIDHDADFADINMDDEDLLGMSFCFFFYF